MDLTIIDQTLLIFILNSGLLGFSPKNRKVNNKKRQTNKLWKTKKEWL